MALKPCPECGTEVSTKAATCPQCGTPLKSGVLDTSVSGNARTCLGCLAWPIIIFVVFVVVSMVMDAT